MSCRDVLVIAASCTSYGAVDRHCAVQCNGTIVSVDCSRDMAAPCSAVLCSAVLCCLHGVGAVPGLVTWMLEYSTVKHGRGLKDIGFIKKFRFHDSLKRHLVFNVFALKIHCFDDFSKK